MARANPFLAGELLRRDRSAQFALGVDITREEREEERLEEERVRAVTRRNRRSSTARAVGRIAGGIGGFLLGGPGGSKAGAAAGAAAGSYLGQRTGRFLTEGKKFDRIAPGTYFVAGGERRERQFRADEGERFRYINELMLVNAATDAITGFRAKKYGSGILDMLLGSTPAQRTLDPVRNAAILAGQLPETFGPGLLPGDPGYPYYPGTSQGTIPLSAYE